MYTSLFQLCHLKCFSIPVSQTLDKDYVFDFKGMHVIDKCKVILDKMIQKQN